MSPKISEMAAVAEAYCALIERIEVADSAWLQQLASLLPRLHAAVEALGSSQTDMNHWLMPDLDARFELFAQLRRLLGNKDSYWMEFDVAHDGQSMSGSLADDLTDIYCELKHGLKLLDNEPGQASNDWRSGYHLHWGQHLLDAERHLYLLKSKKTALNTRRRWALRAATFRSKNRVKRRLRIL